MTGESLTIAAAGAAASPRRADLRRADDVSPRADRGSRHEPARLHRGDRRRRATPGDGARRRTGVRHRSGAVARYSGLGQGPVRRRRRAYNRGVAFAGVRGHRERRRRRCGTAARSRRRVPGEEQPCRIRRRHDGTQRDLRRHAQPLEWRVLGGRFVRRYCIGGRCRHGDSRRRHRHRRLDPLPSERLRRGGGSPDVWSRRRSGEPSRAPQRWTRSAPLPGRSTTRPWC